MASYLLQALQGVKEEASTLDSFRARIATYGFHFFRFWLEAAYLLPALPYGVSTAVLARSLPVCPKRQGPFQADTLPLQHNTASQHRASTHLDSSSTSQQGGGKRHRSQGGSRHSSTNSSSSSSSNDSMSKNDPMSNSHEVNNAGQPVRTGRYGVYVDWGIRYGPGAREVLDVYVPAHVLTRVHACQQQEWQQQQQQQRGNQDLSDMLPSPSTHARYPGAPVVLFTHGGVWASGEAWHYAWLATRLAQAGCVVVCHTYTLFPEALVPQMVQEASRALSWTIDNVHSKYGGDPDNITCVGHSAGGHLLALALLHRAEVARRALANTATTCASSPTTRLGGPPQEQPPASPPSPPQPPPPRLPKLPANGASVAHQNQSATATEYTHSSPSDASIGEEGHPGWREHAIYLHGPGTSFHDVAHTFHALHSATAPDATRQREQQQQQQQQDQGQEQVRQLPLHPGISLEDGRMPARFVGMCGVYDIARHYEYEQSRGVHNLSMMARAMGGPPHFAALSPSLLLHACAVLDSGRAPKVPDQVMGSAAPTAVAASSGQAQHDACPGKAPRPVAETTAPPATPALQTVDPTPAPAASAPPEQGSNSQVRDPHDLTSSRKVGLMAASVQGTTKQAARGEHFQNHAQEHSRACELTRTALEGDAIPLRSGLAGVPGVAPLLVPSAHLPLLVPTASLSCESQEGLSLPTDHLPDKTKQPSLGPFTASPTLLPATLPSLSDAASRQQQQHPHHHHRNHASQHESGLHHQQQLAAAHHLLSAAGIHPGAPRHLPPTFIMSGCSDFMVPWHEGAQMAACLQRAQVPCRHLIYHHATHGCFIMKWPLLKAASPIEPHTRTHHPDVRTCSRLPVSQHGIQMESAQGTMRERDMNGLPPFARDLCTIVLGGADSKVNQPSSKL